MDVQLKPGVFKPEFDLNSVSFEAIFHADANTRYRYTIAKISKEGFAYTLYRRKKRYIIKNPQTAREHWFYGQTEKHVNYA